MFSWIQRYLQHHFRIIFALLLGIVIIAFVFTFGPTGGFGTADGHRVIDREFFGYNLNDANDQRRLFGDAQLSAQLQFGAFGFINQDQIQQYALQRGAAIHLANKWNIPPATDEEIAASIQNLRMFQGADGQFDRAAYSRFRDDLKTNPRGQTEADIKRVLSDDVRMEKVNKLLAGPGYVLPGDIKTQLERADTTWTVNTATADYAAFAPDLEPTDAELKKFFDENSFRYQVGPRIVASYVEFPTTAYLNEVNVTDAEVRAYYDQNPARFPKPGNAPAAPNPAAPTPADPDADFMFVRPQVEAALKLERAQNRALQAASDFAVQVFESKVKNDATLDQFLAAQNRTPKPLAPFTREAGPTELGGSGEISEEAFKLGPDRFVSEPVRTPGGAAVLFWKETQPPHIPEFQEVRERVATDYTESEKRKRFVELGKTIKNELESRLKAGDTFEQAAAAAARTAGLKLATKTVGPFTARNRPQDLDYSAANALDGLDQGEVSDMVLTADKGIFVHAAEKKAPDLSESNPRYVETREQVARYTAQMAASAYLSEIVDKELARTEPKFD